MHTEFLAEAHKKPYIHTDRNRLSTKEAARVINKWIQRHWPKVLNVAREMASKDPKIYQATRELLELATELNRRSMMAKKVLVLVGKKLTSGG